MLKNNDALTRRRIQSGKIKILQNGYGTIDNYTPGSDNIASKERWGPNILLFACLARIFKGQLKLPLNSLDFHPGCIEVYYWKCHSWIYGQLARVSKTTQGKVIFFHPVPLKKYPLNSHKLCLDFPEPWIHQAIKYICEIQKWNNCM